MGTILTILIALVVFGVIVIFHELGHFMAAKSVGIRVEEFALGMGPKLLNLKRGETEYSLRAFPIGGFVKMMGEDEDLQDDRAFNNQTVWKRLLAISAGPAMNFVLAMILIASIGLILGFPVPVIDNVFEDSPAQQAGLMKGDKIISIEGMPVESTVDVINQVQASEVKPLEIEIERNRVIRIITVVPEYDEDTGRMLMGVNFTIRRSLFQSASYGVKNTFFIIGKFFEFFGDLIFRREIQFADSVVGPVGIISEVGKAAERGIAELIGFGAFISINLAIINLIPFPALDGSRIIFLLIEGVRGKPIDRAKEGFVHFTGFVLLMILMLYITFKDILRI